MKIHQRRTFFMIFAIFFAISAPILIIYSMGFNINFRNTEIRNNLSIKVDSKPSGALVFLNEKNVGVSPLDFGISDDNLIQVGIKKPDFVDENFTVSGNKNSNSQVDLSNLSLLPTASEKIFTPKPDQKIVGIISESQLLIDNKNSLEIQDFVLSGITNSSQILREKTPDGGKNISKSDLSQDTIDKLKQPESRENKWKKLDQNYLYFNNVLLVKKSDYWLTINLSKLNLSAKQVTKLDDKNILILDNEKKLWVYNIDKQTNSFFDSGFESITALPYSTWLWKNDSIYKLENTSFLDKKIDLNKYIYLKNENISDQIGKEFAVQNLFQGVAIQTGVYLYYIPDYQTKSWQLLSSNIFSFASENETVFWLNNDGKLYTENMYNSLVKMIAKDLDLTTKIGYNKDWRRIMLYYPNQIKSIWYNKDDTNNTIKSHSHQTWLSDQTCYPKIIDKAQFCLQKDELIVYKNNNIF
jgi:PEGA domain